MTANYAVKVFAGPYSWTVTDADAAGYGLADPLTITRSLPDSDLAPMVQQEPDTASFSVVVANFTDIAQLQVGSAVTIRYWKVTAPAAGDAPLFDFCGRVAQLTMKPHDLGCLVTVSCVDYLADLAEPQVGAVAWAQESLDARCRRILTEAGMNIPTDLWIQDVDPSPVATIVARSAGATGAWEILTHTLDQFRCVFPGFPASTGRAVVRQVTTPAAPTWSSGASTLDTTLGPYQLDSVTRSVSYAPPLRVVNFFGTHLLSGDAANTALSSVIVDGTYIDKDVTWTQRKGQAVNAWSVASDSFGVQTASWGMTPKVWANVDTELLNAADGLALAQLYLTPGQPTGKVLWVADQFRWVIARDPNAAWVLPTALGRLFTIYDIALKWGVGGQTWWAGLCMAWTFTLAGGEPQASVQLAPWNVDPSVAVSPITIDDPGWSGTVVRTNLATNPSAEVDASNYSAVGGGVTLTSFAATPAAGIPGSKVLRGVGTTTGGDTYALMTIPALPSTLYRVNVYRFIPSALTGAPVGNRSVWVQDSTGASAQTTTLTVGATTGTWVREQVTITTAAGHSGNMQVRLYVPNGTVYWDALLVEQAGASGAAYFDGDTTDTPPDTYDWTGTVGLSSSTDRQGVITIDSLMVRDTFDDYRLAKGPAS